MENVTFRTRIQIRFRFTQHLTGLVNLFANSFLHLFFSLVSETKLGGRFLQGSFHAQQFSFQFVVFLRDFLKLLATVWIG